MQSSSSSSSSQKKMMFLLNNNIRQVRSCSTEIWRRRQQGCWRRNLSGTAAVRRRSCRDAAVARTAAASGTSAFPPLAPGAAASSSSSRMRRPSNHGDAGRAEGCRGRSFSTSPSSPSSSEIPFYGLPRPTSSSSSSSIGEAAASSRFGLLLRNAAAALNDPTRADAVAAVGELTGTLALQRLHGAMLDDPNGKIILEDRPVVGKATIPYDRLINEAKSIGDDVQPEKVTFGQAYGAYLSSHGFDPDERDVVRYIDDPSLAYVMLRYRQCHDFWHALTDLPPTVPGELGLKWLELFQTGLPLAAFSSTLGSVGLLSYYEQHVVFNVYLPWACRVSKKLPFGSLMMVYYEKEFDTPVVELRERLGIEPAPQNVEGH